MLTYIAGLSYSSNTLLVWQKCYILKKCEKTRENFVVIQSQTILMIFLERQLVTEFSTKTKRKYGLYCKYIYILQENLCHPKVV